MHTSFVFNSRGSKTFMVPWCKELIQSTGSQDKEAVSSGHGPQPDIKGK